MKYKNRILFCSILIIYYMLYPGIISAYKKQIESKELKTLYQKEDKTLRRIVLGNGLVVILKEKHSIPMVSMQMWVRAGSITEGKNLGSGLSHYFEHMLGKRTKTKGIKEAYYNEIRSFGGSDVNAYTSYDKTVYHFTIHSEYFKKGLLSLSDMIMNSVFDEEESKKEIEVILKEINMSDDNPRRYLWKTLVETVFTTSNYRYPVIGYRNLFKSLGKEDMLSYYKTMYTPNNMILVIVGDFSLDDAEAQVRSAFDSFERKKLPAIYIPEEPKQIEQRKVIKEFGVNTTKAILAYPTTDALSSDVFALDVLALILGEGETSRLYSKLKDKEQIVNNISASSWTPKHKGIFFINFDLDYKNLYDVASKVSMEINNIISKGVAKKELKRAKQKVLVSFVHSMQTLRGYASSLAMGEFLGNLSYNKLYLEKINKVTQKDIIRVARKYLRNDNSNLVALVPKGTISNNAAISVNEDLKEKDHIEKIKLKNGLTLLLKKDSTLPLISFSLTADGGHAYENEENQGIYNLLFQSLLKGTKKRNAKEIARIIEDTGGSLHTYSNENFSGISGSFLKEDSKKMFELLIDILSNSRFRDKEIDKVKKDILHDIKTRDDDIWRASRFHLRKVRYKNHSYSFDGIGTTKSINTLTPADINKLYNSVITPKNLVVSVFGDIDKDSIIKLFSTKSRFLKRKRAINKPKAPPAIEDILKETHYIKEEKKQSIIKILFDAANHYEEDSYPLMLLSYVFSGIGSRLFMDLRDKQGLAYATGGFYQARYDLGLFLFYIGTEPSKKDLAIDGIFKHISKIKEDLITEKELEIAKNSAIGKIIKSLETLNGQTKYASLYEKLNLGYDYYFKLIDKLKLVTKEDIKRVASKYFKEDNYVISIVESKRP